MDFKYIAFILGIILLCSCQDTLTESEGLGKTVLIPLYVSTSDIHSSHAVPEAKDAIQSLHILIFAGNTTNLEQASLVYTVKATMQEGNNFVAGFIKSQDIKDLYRLVLLANVDDTKVKQLTKGNTYNQISESLYEDAQQRYSPDAPVRMFGVVNRGEGIQITENMSLGTISLIRAVARIDIGVGTYNEESRKWDLGPSERYFELTDVEAWSPMKRIYNMPAGGKFDYESNGTPLVSSATSSLSHSATKAVRWKYTGADILNNGIATYCKDVIFLPEAALKGYTAHQPLNSDKRTALIIGGILHDPANPAAETKTWYRVDFTTAGGNTPDGALFDILRNQLYRISLNVGVAGAASAEEAWNIFMTPDQVKVDVASWTDGGSVDVPNSPSISIDKENSTLPEGVDITTADNRISVSNIGGEMWLAFGAETPVEVANVINPFPGRLQIDGTGTTQAVGDKMVTRFKITVQEQKPGREGYAVQIDLKSPLQQLAYNHFTINVHPSDKLFEVVTLGGHTWMAFNSMGKGNDTQLYLEPEMTVQEMYEQQWVETLGRQFQFGTNVPYVPWKRVPGRLDGNGNFNWNDKPNGAPCPDGYRAPTLSELQNLFPPAGSQLSLQKELTYTYNGETITAVLKQGTPATITFPESTIKGYTYYIALTSKETGNVMYIPYGGWKEINKEETDPNTLNGVHYWADDRDDRGTVGSWGVRKGKEDMTWVVINSYRYYGIHTYLYMRCIKK